MFVYLYYKIHHRISRQKMAVPAVLSPQVVRDEKHKVDEALRYIKAKLAEARTLERRKVCCSFIIHTSTVQLSIPCSASENIHTLGINLCQPGI